MSAQELQATEKKEIEPQEGEFTREGVYFSPAVDIFETEKEMVLLVDMPGVSTDHVDIDLNENVLSIVGKTLPESAAGDELLREYRTGNYYRSFRVADTIDQGNIAASMTDGVLKLVLPKSEKAAPRKIQVSVG